MKISNRVARPKRMASGAPLPKEGRPPASFLGWEEPKNGRADAAGFRPTEEEARERCFPADSVGVEWWGNARPRSSSRASGADVVQQLRNSRTCAGANGVQRRLWQRRRLLFL